MNTYINSKDARAFFEGLLNAYVWEEGSFPRETEQRSASRTGRKKSLLRNVKAAPGQARGYLCFLLDSPWRLCRLGMSHAPCGYHAGKDGPTMAKTMGDPTGAQ